MSKCFTCHVSCLLVRVSNGISRPLLPLSRFFLPLFSLFLFRFFFFNLPGLRFIVHQSLHPVLRLLPVTKRLSHLLSPASSLWTPQWTPSRRPNWSPTNEPTHLSFFSLRCKETRSLLALSLSLSVFFSFSLFAFFSLSLASFSHSLVIVAAGAGIHHACSWWHNLDATQGESHELAKPLIQINSPNKRWIIHPTEAWGQMEFSDWPQVYPLCLMDEWQLPGVSLSPLSLTFLFTISLSIGWTSSTFDHSYDCTATGRHSTAGYTCVSTVDSLLTLLHICILCLSTSLIESCLPPSILVSSSLPVRLRWHAFIALSVNVDSFTCHWISVELWWWLKIFISSSTGHITLPGKTSASVTPSLSLIHTMMMKSSRLRLSHLHDEYIFFFILQVCMVITSRSGLRWRRREKKSRAARKRKKQKEQDAKKRKRKARERKKPVCLCSCFFLVFLFFFLSFLLLLHLLVSLYHVWPVSTYTPTRNYRCWMWLRLYKSCKSSIFLSLSLSLPTVRANEKTHRQRESEWARKSALLALSRFLCSLSLLMGKDQ